MGYDGHASAAIAIFSSKAAAIKDEVSNVLEVYKGYIQYGKKHFPPLFAQLLTFNGAGSKTYMFYSDQKTINDIALGSGLVKPTTYDLETLTEHKPALYLAVPVLKNLEGTKIPFIESVTWLWPYYNPNKERTYFLYGGGWMATPVSPAGLEGNFIYGESTNQSIWNGSETTKLRVDDYVFFRPRQSEKLMLRYGAILLVRKNKVVGSWQVLSE